MDSIIIMEEKENMALHFKTHKLIIIPIMGPTMKDKALFIMIINKIWIKNLGIFIK